MPAVDLIARARRVRLLTCDVDGVLTDGRIYVADDGRETKAYSCLDGLGMKWLERSGVAVAWITGSTAPAVVQRATTLGVERVFLGAEDKLEVWERLRAELSIERAECAHIGDDFPDLAVIARCGLGATVPRAPEPLQRRAHYVTRNEGGKGAVRELAELILAAQGKLEALLASYGEASSPDLDAKVRRL
ncbi:MAG: phenylphosphate carboxylase subunit delta [Betaproteobacteria bacterium]|nr:MAG: phenylphosphate carboxylase subunit delta [Betaproteobacteria bacterium]